MINKNKKLQIKEMMIWAKKLFPINRSITGKGTRETLSFFEKINQEFKRIKFKSGTKIFDWIIPNEWNVKAAYFIDKNNKKYADFKKNNLHLMGYSMPIKKIVDKKELIKHIITIKEKPKLIPYATSYYKKDWAFCISENEKKMLPNGKYKILIDTEFSKGHLEISEAILRGKSKKEIFFNTYICHPSMANNELSGPILMNFILNYLKNNYSKTNYTYRFVMLPETIGSIAYLSKKLKVLKQNMIAGFNLSCVGDNFAYSQILSRNGNTLADQALSSALNKLKNAKSYSYLNRGSDERQYCWPGVDLPLTTFCRSKFGSFEEYHTNADNLSFISKDGFEGSFNVIKNIIASFELGLYPKASTICEPKLDKYKLWPTRMQHNKFNQHILKKYVLTLDLLAHSDGINNIFQISKLLDCPLELVLETYKNLKSKKLLNKT